MSTTKKRALIIIPLILVLLAGAFCLWYFLLREDRTEAPVSVERVSVITGMGGGLRNRFAGVVEPQATLEVQLDASRVLDETYVEEGDIVEEGDPLFCYDVEELELQIQQQELNIERTENTIDSLESQISTLKKQRDKLTSDALKLEYTQQIQSYEAQVKQEEYNLSSQQLELENMQEKVTTNVVYAEMAGMIQSITDMSANNNYYGYNDGSSAYITILATGDYRVKGQINEQNIWDLESGGQVLVRSRLDESIVWHGTVDYVDMENPVSDENSYYYYGPTDEMTTSTKYPFYIALEDAEGLMLGQHVYIEPDVSTEEEGLWLMEYYILSDEDGTAWVWAVNTETDTIEKRVVTLGGYDLDTQCFEITGGLTPEDEIAWPAAEIRAGQAVTREGFVDYGYMEPDIGEKEPTGDSGLLEEALPEIVFPEMEEGMELEEGIVAEEGGVIAEAPALEGSQTPEEEIPAVEADPVEETPRVMPTITPHISDSDITVEPPASGSDLS